MHIVVTNFWDFFFFFLLRIMQPLKDLLFSEMKIYVYIVSKYCHSLKYYSSILHFIPCCKLTHRASEIHFTQKLNSTTQPAAAAAEEHGPVVASRRLTIKKRLRLAFAFDYEQAAQHNSNFETRRIICIQKGNSWFYLANSS